jgi:hypothetical protein
MASVIERCAGNLPAGHAELDREPPEEDHLEHAAKRIGLGDPAPLLQRAQRVLVAGLHEPEIPHLREPPGRFGRWRDRLDGQRLRLGRDPVPDPEAAIQTTHDQTGDRRAQRSRLIGAVREQFLDSTVGMLRKLMPGPNVEQCDA